jgi:hypothetical protein
MIILTEKLSNTISRLPKGQVGIFLPDSPFLPENISFHTDLRVFYHNNTVICPPSLKRILTVTLPEEIRIICGEREPEGLYPNDVLYNAVAVGRFLIANEKTVAKEILDYTKSQNMTLIPVKQGYCRCNVTIVSNTYGKEAIITEDEGVAKKAMEYGIDVLLIPAGGVTLTGWKNGFIGGASVSTQNEIIFFGDIALHPQGKEISDFCALYGKQPFSLIPDSPLFDYGGGYCL